MSVVRGSRQGARISNTELERRLPPGPSTYAVGQVLATDEEDGRRIAGPWEIFLASHQHPQDESGLRPQ